MSAALAPHEIIAQARRGGVKITAGDAPGRIKLRGTDDAISRWAPIIAQCKAAILPLLEAAANDPAPGEREPSPVAMSAAELATFARRVERFTMRGLCAEASEREADRLAARDRDGDDRRLCLECLHLRGSPQAWRCGNAWRAGIGGPALPSDLAGLLQRCPGFADTELEGPSCA